MNPKFTEVTMNSFILIMNFYCTDPARKFGMIDIEHEVSFCLLHRALGRKKGKSVFYMNWGIKCNWESGGTESPSMGSVGKQGGRLGKIYNI